MLAAGPGAFFGQMGGEKVSDATDCAGGESGTGDSGSSSGAGDTPVETASMQQIFALAESKLSEYFPAGAITATLENYVFRFYPTTNVYLAFANDTVYLLGGPFGDAIVEAGPISAVLATLDAYVPETSGGGSSGGSAELWNLNISGTFVMSISPTPFTFGDINVAGIPAPDLNDLEAVNTDVENSLAGAVTGISSITVNVVNNSASQRTFDVTIVASTFSGQVTYSLRYDYTR